MGRGLSLASKQIIQNAYDLLVDEHPSGVRRVAYGLYGNQAGAHAKRVGELLTRARKTGEIPWEWISDETRPERAPFVAEDFGSMRDIQRACPNFDPWVNQPARVCVWSEKSVGGTLAPVLDDYLVPFRVHHGNTSTTIMRQTAESTRRDPRSLTILYVGDHDPKGLRISEDDIPKRLQAFGAINYRVRRLALLQDDAERLRDVRDAFKPDDKDVPWYRRRTGLNYGVELEAISSTDLRERVERAILEEIVDHDAWNRTMTASNAVRESWQTYVDQWPIPGQGSR